MPRGGTLGFIQIAANPLKKLEPARGIEPPTYALRMRRSTVELRRLMLCFQYVIRILFFPKYAWALYGAILIQFFFTIRNPQISVRSFCHERRITYLQLFWCAGSTDERTSKS